MTGTFILWHLRGRHVKGQGFFDDSIKALILKRMIMKGRGDKFRDVIYGRPLIRHVLYANYNY